MRFTNPELFARIYGCEIAGAIANAFGDKVESRSYQWVENRYGILDRFVESREEETRTLNDFTYDQYRYRHTRVAGSTEDGFERHKLCAFAIARKGGHIDVNDLTSTFVRYIDNTRFGYLLGWQDQFVYYSGRAMKRPEELGEFASWPGKIGTSKMIMPIGMINAGDPDRAYREAVDCARIKDATGIPGNYGVEVAGLIAAAVAEALKPDATVDSVIDTVFRLAGPGVRGECEAMLGIAKSASHWRDIREPYTRHFEGRNESMADEILSAGLAAFWLSKGDPREAVIIASNIGRDTDCKAYVAAGLAGALQGISAIPADWIKIVENDVQQNELTLTRQTSWERAVSMYAVVQRDRGEDPEQSTGSVEAIVREKLGLLATAVLYPEDYTKIRSLDLGKRSLSSLEGIEKLVNLDWLKADCNQLEDLTPLSGLTKLRYLDLGDNRIRDLTPLRELKDMRTLFLCGNRIEDISVLEGFVELGFLHLAGNRISDLSPLASMELLEGLLLDNNDITDLAPVSGNRKLKCLGIAGNRVKSLEAAAGFSGLIALYGDGNEIETADPLKELAPALKCLTLSGNRIHDGSPFGHLYRLIHLDISGNPLKNLDFLQQLTCLGALDMDSVGAVPSALPASLRHLSVRNNSWSETGILEGLEKLRALDLSGNRLSDGTALQKLKGLKFLGLEDTGITEENR